VRIESASVAAKVTVAEVMPCGAALVALHFEPGEMTKTAEAPEASDTTASEAGITLEPNGDGRPGKGN